MEFLTVDEIAGMLKVSHEFVYKNRRLFGGVKVGRLIRFPKEVFETIIKEVVSYGSIQASGRDKEKTLDETRGP